MRASARTRVTFVPAKVTKTIRSDAQPFGFPRVLGFGFLRRSNAYIHVGVGQTGEAVNSFHSDIRPLVSCLPCAARLRASRSCRTNLILLQVPTCVGDCSPRGIGSCEGGIASSQSLFADIFPYPSY